MVDTMFSCWLTRYQVDFYTDFVTRQPLVLSFATQKPGVRVEGCFLRIDRWRLRFYMIKELLDDVTGQ